MFCFPNSDQVMFSREFVFSKVMDTYTRGCTCIGQHVQLKETILWGTIMWSETGKQNIQAKTVCSYSGILTVEHTLSYSFVYVVICSQASNRFKAKVLLNFTDAMEANVVCIHCTHVNTKKIDIATVFEDRWCCSRDAYASRKLSSILAVFMLETLKSSRRI